MLLTHPFVLITVIFLLCFAGCSSNLNLIVQSKDLIQTTKTDPAYCQELSNQTVGIIGLGALGLSVGKTLKDLGVSSILYHDLQPVENAMDIEAVFVGKEELLKRSDIIFVCSNMESSGKKPYVIFNKEAFRIMKSSAILIDATKGLFVDYVDLYNALRDGEIAAVGLDVREYDVIPNRHPLTVLENCYFLPYRECYKWDGRRKCAKELASSVLYALQEFEFTQKQKAVRKAKHEQIASSMRVVIET